jgi:DNA-binding transcriptional LysR family regulator
MHNPNRPLPPLDLIRGFEAAARRLSFTQAAAELFVTQSAVSRQVQALEAFLGVKLFERRHKALALTQEGQSYYRAAASALSELRAATQQLRDATRGHVLTVTSTVSFASLWLVPRLARFRESHPGIDVRIAATPELLDLAREGIDVAIRDMPSGSAPPGAVHLVGERLGPVASPAYLRKAKAALRVPGDLARHVMLQLHDPQGRWPWLAWAAWLEANGVPGLVPAGSLTYDQYDQVINAALHGQGVALGRMSLMAAPVAQGKLVPLFGGTAQIPRALHAVYAPGAASRPEARAFVQWVKREVDVPDPPGSGSTPRGRKARVTGRAAPRGRARSARAPG